MKNHNKDPDCTFAVQIRTRFRQPLNNKERLEIIDKPTKDFLQEIIQDKPLEIACFLGSAYDLPEEFYSGRARNLYIVNNDSQVAYLGMIFNKDGITNYRRYHIPRTNKTDPAKSKKLRKSRFIKERYSWIIASQCKEISEDNITEEVLLHLSRFNPHFTQVNIRWLREKLGDRLDRTICKKVDVAIKEKSYKEIDHLLKIAQDELL